MDKSFFDTEEYNFTIPKELIAQTPAKPRDSCRLLVIDRADSTIKETRFKKISEFFNEGDVLVLNDTKVIRARLEGVKQSGAKVEILLLGEVKKGVWRVLVNPGKRAKIGDQIIFKKDVLSAEVIDRTDQGGRILKFDPSNLDDFLLDLGQVPLPPYIKDNIQDPNDYQTIYAKKKGAVAAPTAGLHFTRELLSKLEDKGVVIAYITLHCGLATFRPVKVKDIRQHRIDSEWVDISSKTVKIINSAKKRGKRVIAVGTTAVRSLESAVSSKSEGHITSFSGSTRLYITPGYEFKIVDALITNFHTPASTNLILVSSFASSRLIKDGYRLAKDKKFRFYSFGDAMLIK